MDAKRREMVVCFRILTGAHSLTDRVYVVIIIRDNLRWWGRQDSDMWHFERFLKYWGWNL
jgi:hypothetical protein